MTTNIFLLIALALWMLVVLISCIIIWLSKQPGHRRRRQIVGFFKQERRKNKEDVDLINLPLISVEEAERRRLLAIKNAKSCPPECPFYNTRNNCNKEEDPIDKK